ncbi:P-loop containing nucleoside triphosphate hydrolase protein [Cucurbitaria berberidis CBS 394.84]|uniref:ATP-dependent DNA helicase n=1 Tax=Cucurbitaria berberidis CBS 394.84 TaxID=1168544 RepID=A0A9P4G824_9PLEO|nr:P-loop containing nucleoside triphosphate hydrolase protein [Cucurbitaria berberidis CBS 394.84]KAF1840459.1 P-loop containing nucleoside triphosphate hydrolase protein [Cucurbitaria berberidis CBS 394.84]
MADSDEYGDEFDDTEFLDAATQAEKEDSPTFQASPRPAKRRKVNLINQRTASIPPERQQSARRGPFISSDEEDTDNETDHTLSDAGSTRALPNGSRVREHRPASRKKAAHSKQKADRDFEMDDASPVKETKAQKRQERIHVPTTNLDMTDTFYTQPPQEHSPPWKPRGAIWAKKTATIGVHRPSEPTKWTGLDAMKTSSLPGGQSISLPLTNGATVDYDFTQDLADLPSDAFASSSSSPQKQNGDVLVTGAHKHLIAPKTGLRQTTLFGRAGNNATVPPSQANKRYSFVVDQKQEPPTHHKLDAEAMKTWVYPTNLGTIRDYQFNIVQRGLFSNLLVALPTGLGKTFIAATIMLNWFRWTTEAQIVFVAPTKPLVSQQVEACYKTVGIPRSYTTMLTGGVSPGLRSEEWRDKRVFFMTPQTLLNDLKGGYADPKKIVLLVVDEAHRATGAYAYVEVVSFLRRFNQSFRVLALTATPGADVEAVQKVIDGLDISRVEIRTENSMDICSYVHQRKIEKHVFQNSDEMELCMDLYSQALQPLVNTIAGLNAYWSKNPRDLTPYGCQQAKKKWSLEAGRNANQGVKSTVHTVFSILASISHGMDLLKYHGIGPFYVKMKEFQDESVKTKSKYKKQILDSDAWKKLMSRLHGWVNDDNFVGHPKLEFLQQVILDHFVNAGDGRGSEDASPTQTRIMVFAHFRDSAEEIARILKRHQPMIRPRVFVGQSHGKNSEGMSQKEQLDVIEKFKSGTHNTLIATSIGEEGLDIGEVDLIICYDSKASPIRMLQRMGRTGRKREGKIVMLQMQGKEETDANKAKDSYEKMQEIIANGSHFNFHDEISRRILPQDVKPTVDRRVVDIPPENSQQQDWLPEPKKGRRTKKPPKKFHMPDGVLTGFVTAGRMDEEIVPKRRGNKGTAAIRPSEEVFDLPPLQSVLLDEKATQDLERRFQTVFDDDDSPMVNELDLGRHFERQRTLCRTQHLSGPGRVTRSFVGMMQRMRDVDHERLDSFKQNLHCSDCESDAGNNYLVSDTEPAPPVHEDAWADDDPASQPLPKAKVKAKPGPKPKAKTTPKTPAPRGRPRKDKIELETPTRQPQAKSVTPPTKTPNWRVSGLAQEGDESSPPPTDPRFHIASQADTIGSDDTMGEDEVQDTQAYKLDSELASFIVEDEEVDIPPSSLPSLDLSGVGRGTQAVVKAGRPKRPPKREKIFTSDPTDDDAIVSSDSEEDAPLAEKKAPFVIDSASENEEELIVPRKRARRVIDDDEDEE